jgi:hypothetical protein
MDKYGISILDVRNCQMKRDNQISYLEANSFQTANGELKSFKDISMSANISSRYYAQLVNKVNTLQQVMTSENLIPIFITITLTGVLHDLIYGDYKRFDDDKHLDLLPETDQHGYLKSKALNRETFTPSELYQVIRYLWTKFQKSYQYMKMKKEGHKVGYLFNTEPHESGVPHSHVLLYIPVGYKTKLLEVFKKIFNAPRNIGQDKKRLTKEQIKNGEINGFQWTLSNPVGYVMKYCTKSFMDIQNESKLDELQAWYMKHRIIRISMSHTLVPQWVYQKIYPLESDWLYLSELRINSTCEWSQKEDTFEFYDDYKKQTLKYDNGLYQQFIDGKLVREFGTKKHTIKHSVTIDGIEYFPLVFATTPEKSFENKKFKARYPFGKPISKKQNRVIAQYKVKFGYQDYLYLDNNWVMLPIVPSNMNNLELYQYYLKLSREIDTVDLVHFGITQNECIKRGLIDDIEIQSLNDFNTDIGA